MTQFSFEHVFRAPSAAAVFAAYFDPQHQAEQDRALEISERNVLEFDDRGDELRRVCRVVPKRQLPAIARSVVGSQLQYLDTATWNRREDAIAIEIRMGKRVHISGTYRLEAIGPNAIRRTYSGNVSVDIALVSGRVERGIVGELANSMAAAAQCTQSWLDRHEG